MTLARSLDLQRRKQRRGAGVARSLEVNAQIADGKRSAANHTLWAIPLMVGFGGFVPSISIAASAPKGVSAEKDRKSVV